MGTRVITLNQKISFHGGITSANHYAYWCGRAYSSASDVAVSCPDQRGFATLPQLDQSGGSFAWVKLVLGHSSLDIVKRYLAISEQDLEQSHNQVTSLERRPVSLTVNRCSQCIPVLNHRTLLQIAGCQSSAIWRVSACQVVAAAVLAVHQARVRIRGWVLNAVACQHYSAT